MIKIEGYPLVNSKYEFDANVPDASLLERRVDFLHRQRKFKIDVAVSVERGCKEKEDLVCWSSDWKHAGILLDELCKENKWVSVRHCRDGFNLDVLDDTNNFRVIAPNTSWCSIVEGEVGAEAIGSIQEAICLRWLESRGIDIEKILLVYDESTRSLNVELNKNQGE